MQLFSLFFIVKLLMLLKGVLSFCLSCMCHVFNEKRMREKEAKEQWKGTEKGRFFFFASPLLIALGMLLACLCLLFVCLSACLSVCPMSPIAIHPWYGMASKGTKGQHVCIRIHNSAHSYIRSTSMANKANKQHLFDWNEEMSFLQRGGMSDSPTRATTTTRRMKGRPSCLRISFIYSTPSYQRQ